MPIEVSDLSKQIKDSDREDNTAWAALYQTSVKKLRESTEQWKDGLDVTLVFVGGSLRQNYCIVYLD